MSCHIDVTAHLVYGDDLNEKIFFAFDLDIVPLYCTGFCG